LIVWEISDFLKFNKNLVWTKTARPSPWLQSHKSVTAKSQKGWCQCSKVINYSTRMIVVSVEPTEPMGKSLSEVCQSQNSVWPLKGVVFKSMWLHVTKKGFSLWGLINRVVQPLVYWSGETNPFECQNMFPVWGLATVIPRDFIITIWRCTCAVLIIVYMCFCFVHFPPFIYWFPYFFFPNFDHNMVVYGPCGAK
jgi:hypothetical protein